MDQSTTTFSGFFALVGSPNAGKSSLLNTLVGETLSGVSSKPQTTRRRHRGVWTKGKSQVVFVDTPGVHEATKTLNQFLCDEYQSGLSDADGLVYVVACDQELSPQMVEIYHHQKKKHPLKPTFILFNKTDMDLSQRKISKAQVSRALGEENFFEISAKTGEGVSLFLEALVLTLPEGPFYYPEDELTDSSLRDIAAELIRAQACECLYQELPYSLAVEIESYQDKPDKVSIKAHLIVAEESHKGMVIGQKARMIKKIGTLARGDLEKLVSNKVYLELKVKVDKAWNKDPHKIARYCHGDSVIK